MSQMESHHNPRGRGRGRGGSGYYAPSSGVPSSGAGGNAGGGGNDTSIPMGSNRRTYNTTNTYGNSNTGAAANNTALPPGGGSRRGGGGGGDYPHHRSTPPPQQQQQQQQQQSGGRFGYGNANGVSGGGYDAAAGSGLRNNTHVPPNAPSFSQSRQRRGSFGNGGDTTAHSGAGPSSSSAASSHQQQQQRAFAGAGPSSAQLSSSAFASAAGSATPPPSTAGPSPDTLLSVMDMGLDFRSYQGFSDPTTGRAVVGNIVTFAADRVPDVFQPTVGLLVTMLHMYFISRNHEAARTWIRAYETVQRLFLDSVQNHQTHQASLSASFSSQPGAGGVGSAGAGAGGAGGRGGSSHPLSDLSGMTQQARENAARQAEDAVRIISQHDSASSRHPDHKLCERLLVLLDHQSGVRGGGGGGGGGGGQQVPSQRRVPPAPKATFCNLHLSDLKCHQDFSCNQVHLHQVGSVRHRVEYHSRLVQCLLGNRLPPEEVDQRLRDSLFYANFGNKVTLRCADGSWVQFFKTLYTPSRLDLALRKTTVGHVKLQDGGGGGGGGRQQHGAKPMDLATSEAEVRAFLDEGCREVYTALEQKIQQQHAAKQQAIQAVAAAKTQQLATAALARQQQQQQNGGAADSSAVPTSSTGPEGTKTAANVATATNSVVNILTTSMAAVTNANSNATRSGGASAATTPPLTQQQPQVILATNVHNMPAGASAAAGAAATTTTIGSHIDTPDATPGRAFQLGPSSGMIPWASSVTATTAAGGAPTSTGASPQRQTHAPYGAAVGGQATGGGAAAHQQYYANHQYQQDADDSLVREYVRLTGITEKEQRANEALLSALQVGSGSAGGSNGHSASAPITPESFTPLMHEVQMRRFGSESVGDGDFRY